MPIGNWMPESDLVPAPYGTRAKAFLIDFLLIVAAAAVPAGFIWYMINDTQNSSGGEFEGMGVMIMVVLMALAAGITWPVWQVSFFGFRQGVTGTTPGKRHQHIRLIDIRTGEAPGGGRGMGRFLVVPALFVFSGLLFGLAFGSDRVAEGDPITAYRVARDIGLSLILIVIDYMWPLWDGKKQRLTDKVFKTQVVASTH